MNPPLRPSAPRLLWLFARTAARRFCNRFLLGWQRARMAKLKKRGLPVPERTAGGHRLQRFRAGSLLVVLLAVYMMFVMLMAVEISLRRAVNGVGEAREPVAALTDHAPGGRLSREARNPDSDPYQHLSRANRLTADRVTALMMLTAGAGALCFGIGMASRNLARPEPSLAWLFEFPVPRPALFATRLSETLFDGATLPLLSMLPGILLYYKGHGFWASAGWGLAFGALMALAAGALRIACEVVMLQKLPRRRRGTLGGLCAAAGTLLMVVILYGGGTPVLQRALLAGADALPGWFFWNPLSAGTGSGISSPGVQWLLAAVPVAALCWWSVRFCAGLTRYGLEPGLETARTSALAPALAAPAAEKPPRFSGLMGKELLMLTRQRTVMVQVLLAPVVMVLMFYFQTSGRLAERLLAGEGPMAAALYGICAYMVLIAAQVAMMTELRTLWLLLSLPRPLAEALRVKSRLWGSAAAVLMLVLAVLAMITQPHMAAGLAQRLPFMLVLVWLIAHLTVGIRTMGSCVLSETTVQVRQWANWMPLLLSAGAGQAVHSGDLWMLTVQVVLLGALNVSLWQKLHTDLPWLTEPAEDPPARLTLMHGQFAVYGYFVLQSLCFMLAVMAKLPFAAALPVGAAVAAGLIALITWHSLRRRGIRILPERRPWRKSDTLWTVAGLVAACGAGWFWLEYAQRFHWAADALRQSRAMLTESSPGMIAGLAVLAVIIAPLCEEFLFRGLVYQGLRKTYRLPASVLWSALFFTVVHPPVSAPAVCAVAVVLALVMERTGRLSACIAIHAGYNAFMLAVQLAG